MVLLQIRLLVKEGAQEETTKYLEIFSTEVKEKLAVVPRW
jgi:hypothetical protein